MITKIKKVYYYLGQANYVNKIDKKKCFEENRYKASIVRLTHAIEKGLCISKPRMGYGKEKIRTIIQYSETLIKRDKSYLNDTTFLMAYDALTEYLEWHDERNYSDDTIEKVRIWIDKNKVSYHPDEKYGGTIVFNRKPVDIENVKNLFENRHSSRAFLDKEVDRETLKKAICLANRYPSACNRQAVRIYVVNHSRKDCIKHWFGDKPGFWDDVKEFIMVCAKVSAYVPDEYQQYEVSAGIYTGFLSLALQAYGIGSCVVQREVLSTSDWREFALSLGIPEDEQLICLVACGYQDETYRVPVSHRFTVEEMTKFID